MNGKTSERGKTMEMEVSAARSIAIRFAIAACLLGSALLSEGASQRFILEWSGESQGNVASAKGFLLIDDERLNNPGLTGFPGTSFVQDFRIAVSRARDRSHNTFFDAADFGGISLEFSGGGGDLTRELVGQGEFIGLNLVSGDPKAPNSADASAIQTGGGSGEVLVLTSFRPLVSTSVRVYKCTFSGRGLYSYNDADPSGPGVEQWVSRRYSARASYYMILDSVSELMSFIWVDTRLKQFQRLVDCALPDFNYFQTRAPSTRNPAGDWEVGIPLWSHREDIDIDPLSGTSDASRSRSLVLNGVERLTSFRLPVSRIYLRDLCASSLSGKFCQLTSYDDRHYSFEDPQEEYDARLDGSTQGGEWYPWVTGSLSCRLDTRFTAVGIEEGGTLAAGENAVVDYLIGSGWTAHADIDYAGAPLSLQPTGAEVLEPLIP